MTLAARLLTLLAAIFLTGACSHIAPLTPTPRPLRPDDPLPTDALHASPNRLVGRVLATDAVQRFAFIDLAGSAPAPALVEGAELMVRTDDLRETGRLRAARYVRGRTLATTIISGQPSPGDEVVFRVP